MGRVFACSDLHGRYDLWIKIKERLEADDTLYFLGDAIDRGKGGIAIMQEMFADPRVIYLKGNHEDMMYRAVKGNNSTNMTLWTDLNDGEKTYKRFNLLTKKEQEEILNKIKEIKPYAWYKNIFLSHAGCYGNEIPINENLISKDELSDLMWGRHHFEEYFLSYNKDDMKCDFMVFGHTPVQVFHRQKVYYSGKYKNKIDIDVGAFFTERTVLLDLDTLEEIYIYA